MLARFTLTAVLFALALMLPGVLAGAAHAAPQMLGVVGTKSPQPMTCADGNCLAQLTAFCLQKERGSPADGTAYLPYDPTVFTVSYALADGSRFTMTADEAGLEFVTERGFAAVSAAVPEANLKRMGAVSASIEVASGATLVPKPVAGDPKPLTKDEIRHVAVNMRHLADQWLSPTLEKTAALQTVNAAINLTPRNGAMDTAALHSIWDRATQNDLDSMPAGAADRAQKMVDACVWRVEAGRYHTLRRCLEVKHDSLLNDLNTTYWQGTGAGS